METVRLKHSKPQNYSSNKILVGNWFEQQCEYKKNNFRHNTEYKDLYKPKPYTTYPPAVLWDARIKAKGDGFYPEKSTEATPNFYDNFSTTYDLSYKHFPHFYKDSIIPREMKLKLHTYHPTEEYLKSYGNITNFGLFDAKKNEWTCDVQDTRVTEYEADYIPLEKHSYKFSRWTRPTAVKSKYGKEHRPYPPDHPRFSKFDPITWECKNHLF
ncbi:unnamed protein product [Phaedon cochleariae]|uniref:Uncharacterized protein n=1 Tax=Phaedon cochleariae TaxID=80249 RepID=A0A9N9X2U1_PHACE|nr:unnamed protein product [Phaedon cochleariae]